MKMRDGPAVLVRKPRARALGNLTEMKDRELTLPDFRTRVRTVATSGHALEL